MGFLLVLAMSGKQLFFLIGACLVSFSLSPLCVYLMSLFLPVNAAEIFLLPGLLFLMQADRGLYLAFRMHLRRPVFVVLFFILLLFSALGILTGDNFIYVYSDFRAIFVFMFFVLLIPVNLQQYLSVSRAVVSIFVALSLFDVIYLLLRNSALGLAEQRSIVMTICPFFLSLLWLGRGKYLYAGGFLVLLIFESIVSAMRINYIYVILCLIGWFGFIFNALRSRNCGGFIKLLFLAGALVVAGVALTPLVNNYLQSDSSRYFHAVVRVKQMFSGESMLSGEQVRAGTTFLMVNEPTSLLLPQGLGWRNHVDRIQSLYEKKYGVLSSMDSNLFYCAYHFGLIFGLIVLFSVVVLVARLLLNSYRKGFYAGTLCCLLACSGFLAMFILKSWVFVYLNCGFVYASVIFMMRRPELLLYRQVR